VVAHGPREGGGEYLILERLPGTSFDNAWPTLTSAERQRIATDLALIVCRLHALPVAGWMENPWVRDVLESHRWRDAYHAPFEVGPLLVQSAIDQRPDQRRLLDNVAEFLEHRSFAFGSTPECFIHTDLHLRNVLVDGNRISGLIDYEGSRLGAPDVELDMLLRSFRTGRIDDDETGAWIAAFRRAYPDLFRVPNLIARLEAYEALWHLVQLHHWKPGDRWMSDPAASLADLLRGDFTARITRLLKDSS
jgi:aminoglycoside phosphotransferase (APT) family kinase protein